MPSLFPSFEYIQGSHILSRPASTMGWLPLYHCSAVLGFESSAVQATVRAEPAVRAAGLYNVTLVGGTANNNNDIICH